MLVGMLLAWTGWMISAVVCLTALWVYSRIQSMAGIAFVLILALKGVVRPPMLLTGLDSPIPPSHLTPLPYSEMAGASLLTAAFAFVAVMSHLTLRNQVPTQGFLPRCRGNMALIGQVAFLAALIAVGATTVLVAQYGGPANFMYAVKVSKDLTGSYIYREMATLSGILAMMAFIQGRRKLHLLLFIALIVVIYLWGNRVFVAFLMFAFALAWHIHIRRLTFIRAVSIGVAGLAFLQGLRVLRNSAFSAVTGREVTGLSTFWSDLSASLHFSEFDALLLAFRDVGSRFDFRYGEDFVNGLVSGIPRSIWPEKESVQIGAWFRQIYSPETVNGWPITVPGEWYLNFGLMGILFGGVVTGLACALVDSHYRDAQTNVWSAAVGASLSVLICGGGVSFGIVQRVLLTVVPLMLVALILRSNFPRIVFSRQAVSKW